MELITQTKKSVLALDPRTKFVILFSIGFFIFSDVSYTLELIICAILNIFMFSYKQYSFTIKFDLIFLLLMVLEVFVAPHIPGFGGIAFMALVKLPRRVMLILIVSNLLIKTTSVSEFSASFRKMHVPEQIVIPFSVTFRFIPTIQEEWHSIQDAMKLRGIANSVGAVVRAPMQTLEYALLPILVSVSTIADELAAASLSRGLEVGNERSCLTQLRFQPIDYVMLLLCVAFIVHQVMLR